MDVETHTKKRSEARQDLEALQLRMGYILCLAGNFTVVALR